MGDLEIKGPAYRPCILPKEEVKTEETGRCGSHSVDGETSPTIGKNEPKEKQTRLKRIAAEVKKFFKSRASKKAEAEAKSGLAAPKQKNFKMSRFLRRIIQKMLYGSYVDCDKRAEEVSRDQWFDYEQDGSDYEEDEIDPRIDVEGEYYDGDERAFDYYNCKQDMYEALDKVIRIAKERMDLPQDATLPQARLQYLKFSRDLHPDKTPEGATEEEKRKRKNKFLNVKSSYEMICKEEKFRDIINASNVPYEKPGSDNIVS